VDVKTKQMIFLVCVRESGKFQRFSKEVSFELPSPQENSGCLDHFSSPSGCIRALSWKAKLAHRTSNIPAMGRENSICNDFWVSEKSFSDSVVIISCFPHVRIRAVLFSPLVLLTLV
jgi:hypothetical protein